MEKTIKESKKALELFKEIQKIPYHISVNGEQGYDCEDKANMLVDGLRSLGFEARKRLGIFKWSSVDLSDELKAVPHQDISSHVFVEFKNSDGEWIFVDPTWNPELKEAGFPISIWDGKSGTELAVPCHEFCPAIISPEVEGVMDLTERLDLKVNGEFYKAFNSYCDSFLKKGK